MKNKRIFVTSVGTFLEWAEFTYYAYIATDIAKLFFPQLSKPLALMATFSVFALSYFFRPLGALFFGYIGDTYGRKRALQSSIMLMGCSSILIGCLPTYNQIGVAAIILLLIFRCIQGFAVSGEFNGSAIYLIEHDTHTPYRAGSWTSLSSALGMMFGSLLSILIHLPNMPTWAWRCPFWLGAFSCFCAWFFRSKLTETPDFLAHTEANTLNPIQLLFTHYKKNFIKASILITAIGVYLYTMNIYYGSHLAQYTTLSALQIKWIVTFGQSLVVLLIGFIAKYVDQSIRFFHHERLFTLGLKGFFIAAPIVYYVPYTQSFVLILISQIAYAACNAFVSVPLFKILNDIFPSQVRYTGISVAWSLSMALFSGTAPLVAHYLQQLFHNPTAPIYYIFFTTAMALLIFKRKQNHVTQSSIALHASL